MQCLSKNKRAALGEIADVLRAVCHAHRLPLPLAWIPCSTIHRVDGVTRKVFVREVSKTSNEKCTLFIEETTSYVNDQEMHGFVHACTHHYLNEGQGISGKALQSNCPFFSDDVKQYDISDYPLVHHACKFGLNAVVAIRLRSTLTDYDDYGLEFFFPLNAKNNSKQ